VHSLNNRILRSIEFLLPGMLKKNKKIYLDYAATTPVDPRVLKFMLPYFSRKFGNTASLHSFGQEAEEALEDSRQIISRALGAQSKEIIFTSSATESNNLAIRGTVLANKNKGNHIVVSSIEHDCVLNSARWLKARGFELTELRVDKFGLVDPENIRKAIQPNTILVSVMHANNEIGTIEPIVEIGKICREKNVYFHTDAAQTFGKIPIDVNKMNIDLLTASSHKMYGPKGAACLYLREGIKITPLMCGGGHEGGKRPSTVNVPAIVGFAKATELCLKEMKQEGDRQSRLRDKLIKTVLKIIPEVRLNGHPTKRLPNNANFQFSFIEGEALLIRLDQYGFAVSTGSACSSRRLEASHVLLACNVKPEEAHGSLRITLGRFTKESDINRLLNILPKIVENLRKISPFKI